MKALYGKMWASKTHLISCHASHLGQQVTRLARRIPLVYTAHCLDLFEGNKL